MLFNIVKVYCYIAVDQISLGIQVCEVLFFKKWAINFVFFEVI